MKVSEGSLVGRDHWVNGVLPVGKNNQDAYAWAMRDGAFCGVVADGCGSGLHSEIGAWIGVKAVMDWWIGSRDPGCVDLVKHITDRLRLATYVFGDDPQTINDYFLFTLMIAIVDPVHGTCVLGCGDGVYGVDIGETVEIKPSVGNQPNYLGYNLLSPGKCRLTQHFASTEVHSVIIGTDGLAHYQKWEDEWEDWVRNQVQLTRKFRVRHHDLPDDITAIGVDLCTSTK